MTGGLVEALAEFASSATHETLPEAIRENVKRRVLDTLGVAIAAVNLETSAAVVRHTQSQGGLPQAHILGSSHMVSAAQAAFVNGVLAHSLDYDDTHLPSIVHPSASVVPASIAAAEVRGADGRALVAAIACGLEICLRIGMAGYDSGARQSLYFERGQHATSMCGAIGSAASAALLLGGSKIEVAHAMAISVSFASGVIEANRTGGTIKRLHCGWAAQCGVNAAQLAIEGITGAPTALEGRFGFFQSFIGGKFDKAAFDDLGGRWEMTRIFVKPYPANHFTHALIDAGIALRQKGLAPQNVKAVHVSVASPTVRTIGEPADLKRSPDTGYQAQFSGPYAFVAGLMGGGGLGVGLNDFTDELAVDPDRRALMSKVSVNASAECDRIYPDQLPAIVSVETLDGAEMIERVLTTRGGPERPLTDSELSSKFRDNTARIIGTSAVAEIESVVQRIESLSEAGELLKPASTVKTDEMVR